MVGKLLKWDKKKKRKKERFRPLSTWSDVKRSTPHFADLMNRVVYKTEYHIGDSAAKPFATIVFSIVARGLTAEASICFISLLKNGKHVITSETYFKIL
jgi:hypothetical protein